MKLRLLFVLFSCGLAWFVLSSRSGGLANVANQDRTGAPNPLDKAISTT